MTGQDPNEGKGSTPAARRVIGVDVARGVALLGMIAVHVFPTFHSSGPTVATVIAGGRSAATFALVAGMSLAFLTGGRRTARGLEMTAARQGIVVRAAVVGAIGLACGYLTDAGVDVILTYYGLLFLAAVPLLGLSRRWLLAIAAALAVVVPLLRFASTCWHLPTLNRASPTFTALVTQPAALVTDLVLTGIYPVAAYLVYACVGLAVARSDLRSTRTAAGLLWGGLALAGASWAVSSWLLFGLGGARALGGAGHPGPGEVSVADRLRWEPLQTDSWWWFAVGSPHSGTALDLLHATGSAVAVVGAALLLCRLPAAARLFGPLAAAGSMTLTFYIAHLLVLATGVLGGAPGALYLLVVAAVLLVAPLWRRWCGQGPLERLVSAVARPARPATVGTRS